MLDVIKPDDGGSLRSPPRSISVVVPCFNEEAVVRQLCHRVVESLHALDIPFELLLIDDCSVDRTWPILLTLREQIPQLRAIRLARNCGQQMALTCGLDHASGEVVVIMDADLQDPPELIGPLIAKWRAGYDVVYGQRIKREGEPILKRAFAFAFYRLFTRFSGFPLPRDTGDFRLMDRRVVEVLMKLRERHRFLRGMVPWVGFRQVALQYVRPPRLAGESKYPFRKSLRLAVDALMSFSVAPLRAFYWFGGALLLLSGLGLIAAIYDFIEWSGVENGSAAAASLGMWVLIGFSLMSGILGIQTMLFGVLGEYVGRIFEASQARPLYIIDSALGERVSFAMDRSAPYVQSFENVQPLQSQSNSRAR